MGLGSDLLKRSIIALLLIFLVATLNFVIIHLTPGGPATYLFAESTHQRGGTETYPEAVWSGQADLRAVPKSTSWECSLGIGALRTFTTSPLSRSLLRGFL